ncbi:hypothetical protein [uncultured Mediterranean phage]|nr:hypothetical protein [uncultured Mediterranean phage]
MKGYPKFREEYIKQVGEFPESQARSDFLINFGIDLASRSPSGNIISTAAESAKKPFERFQQQTAYDKAGKREEERDLIKSFIDARATALSDSDTGMFSAQQKAAAIGGYTDELFKLSDDLAAGKITQEDYDKKRIRIWNTMQPYMKDNPEIAALWKVEGYAEDAYKEYKDKILADESPYLDANGQPVIEDGEQITVAEWFSDPKNRAELRRRATNMYLKEAQDKRISMITGELKAEGGRAGYQQGNLVEQMDVDVMTPKGEMAMQETVEEGVMPDQLSFEELRSRLPVEITDDIINLLVSSASALGDFAQIQTQQDVDNFNAKYGVNLVLPSEA